MPIPSEITFLLHDGLAPQWVQEGQRGIAVYDGSRFPLPMGWRKESRNQPPFRLVTLPTRPLNGNGNGNGMTASELWSPDLTAGQAVNIAPTPTPPAPIPTLTPRQFLFGLWKAGMITKAEALAAAREGTMPAAIETIVAGLPADVEFDRRVSWARMREEIRRDDPLMAMIAAARGVGPGALDNFYRTYSAV